jgi:hypothetical protein
MMKFVVEQLAEAFRGLTRAQRLRLREHLRLGHAVACGRSAEFFVNAKGAG